MDLNLISGVAASSAGIPLLQAGGAEIDRLRHEANARRAQAASEHRAAAAAGVAASDSEEKQAGERDADGRRIWEISWRAGRESAETSTSLGQAASDSRELGTELDLCG